MSWFKKNISATSCFRFSSSFGFLTDSHPYELFGDYPLPQVRVTILISQSILRSRRMENQGIIIPKSIHCQARILIVR
jgi:hypothetical protein